MELSQCIRNGRVTGIFDRRIFCAAFLFGKKEALFFLVYTEIEKIIFACMISSITMAEGVEKG